MSDKLVKCEISRVFMHRGIGCISAFQMANCGNISNNGEVVLEIEEQQLPVKYLNQELSMVGDCGRDDKKCPVASLLLPVRNLNKFM